ncbi:MAG: A/G-specific adenine glycosylase [Rhodospirillaceae bacterium]|nr:A/G-specific adenine glycosylase [Rhodospirillaceae bacterium]
MNPDILKSSSGPLSDRLLKWYARHRRRLPWRALPGEKADPYRVWLSEIMLQQTTVATVKPYFGSFLARWPTIENLAAANLDQVLHAWQGLGYYARARNLHKCAQVISREFDGVFPAKENELRKLPGIGPYTAAAIAAIAFDLKATPVDGNFERVMARLHQVETALPEAKLELYGHAEALTPERRVSNYVQAVMDLGATVCTPRNPKCTICPWLPDCRVGGTDKAETYPRRSQSKTKPVRRGVVFWVCDPRGRVLLRRREEKGLLGGMIEVPSTEWRQKVWPLKEAVKDAPAASQWQKLPGIVHHTFTHFHLELKILTGSVSRTAATTGFWCLPEEFGAQALPSVMKKVMAHVAECEDR